MAIPVQGFAAATTLSCKSVHVTPWVKMHAASGHIHHDGMHHLHHHDMADAHQLADDASAPQEKSATSSCSACAVCCIGAAVIPSGITWTAVHNGSEQVLVSPPTLAAGHIPAGPERPPRS